MKHILMLGPGLAVAGGMSAVENIIIENINSTGMAKVDFLPTYKDSGKLKKLTLAAVAFLNFMIRIIFRRVDVVYIHMAADSSFYRKSIFILAGKLFKKRIVIHMHGGYFESFYSKSGQIIRKYIGFVIGRADKIIVLTEEWKKFYLQFMEEDKIEIIHNSVVVGEKSYNSSGSFITFLGKLDARKGVYDILDVVGDIAKLYPDIKFVLAGDGEMEKVLNEAGEKGVKGQIILPGWIGKEIKEKVLDETVVFLLPSYAEGLPMAVLEAMARGIPVIAADVGGLSEIIKDGEDGLLIEPGDKPALKDNIINILNSGPFRLKLSSNSYNKIAHGYNSEKYISRVLDALFDG